MKDVQQRMQRENRMQDVSSWQGSSVTLSSLHWPHSPESPTSSSDSHGTAVTTDRPARPQLASGRRQRVESPPWLQTPNILYSQ